MRLVLILTFSLLYVTHTEARPRAWCGWYLANYFGFSGKLARELWLARNWAVKFPRTSLAPGTVAVFARGRGGHVGKVMDTKPGQVLLHSGNDGGAVRTRWRSTRNLIAVVNPTGGVREGISASKRDYRPNRRARTARLSHGPVNRLPAIAPIN